MITIKARRGKHGCRLAINIGERAKLRKIIVKILRRNFSSLNASVYAFGFKCDLQKTLQANEQGGMGKRRQKEKKNEEAKEEEKEEEEEEEVDGGKE